MKLMMVSKATTDKDLATILHTNANTFSSWKNTTGIIPTETLIDFCIEYNVSFDWLVISDSLELKRPEGSNSQKIPYFTELCSCDVPDCDPDTLATEYICMPDIRCSDRDESSDTLFAVRAFNDELPISAPKGSIMFFNKTNRDVNTYSEIFLIKINNYKCFRRVYETLDGEYCINSEHREVGEVCIKKDKVDIIAKLIGVTKWRS